MKAIILNLILCGSIFASTNYVDISNLNPSPPYTNWSTAATNIQDAITESVYEGLVLVAEGHYEIEERLTHPKGWFITLISTSGPALTVIDAGGESQCYSLNALVSGFTITGGWSENAPISGGIISNCVVTGNYSYGLYASGGAISSAAVYDSIVENNMSLNGTGGAGASSRFIRCTLRDNSAGRDGGALYRGSAESCLIIGNHAIGRGGGASGYRDRYGNPEDYASLVNCTLVSNSADEMGAEVETVIVNNCIFSQDSELTFDEAYGDHQSISFSCAPNLTHGALGNITNHPSFVASDNFRLTDDSPCINAGLTPSVTSATDLDGNPRIVNGTVDMGAYEFQTEESVVVLPMRMTLEQSTDLGAWKSTGETMEWLVPTENSNTFYRARLEM